MSCLFFSSGEMSELEVARLPSFYPRFIFKREKLVSSLFTFLTHQNQQCVGIDARWHIVAGRCCSSNL